MTGAPARGTAAGHEEKGTVKGDGRGLRVRADQGFLDYLLTLGVVELT